MERLLLPLVHRHKPYDGVVVRWHVEEDTPLHRGTPIATLEIGAKNLTFFFRERGRHFVLRKQIVPAGGHITANETLALVGAGGEELPRDDEIDMLPVVGTAKVSKRLMVCKKILTVIILSFLALLLVNFGVSHVASTAAPFVAIAAALDLLSTVVILLVQVVMVVIGIIYMCQMPPELRRVMSFREEMTAEC
jgi:hypothetical protein